LATSRILPTSAALQTWQGAGSSAPGFFTDAT
jgi:hypothetical protein